MTRPPDRITRWQLPTLTPELERELAHAARAGSQAAVDHLCRSHLLLVYRCAKRFAGLGTPREDLVAEGLLGLVEAARRFDPTHGARFSVYAEAWIAPLMRRYAFRQMRVVRPLDTRQARAVRSKLRSTERALAHEYGRPATLDEIAGRLGVAGHVVAAVAEFMAARDVGVGTDRDIGEVDPAADCSSPEDEAAQRETRERLPAAFEEALAALSPGQATALRHRKLWSVDDPVAHALVGEAMGVTRQRARQLEQRALVKLRGRRELAALAAGE